VTAAGSAAGSSTVTGSLAGKTAVVTGASRGIGRAIVNALTGAGARVVGCARRPAPGVHRCDVGDEVAVKAFAAAVLADLGPPDIVVNNAGVAVRARLDDTSTSDWDAVLGSNLRGTFLVTRAFLPGMRARRSGRIVNVASISGRQGTAQLTAYCAAKHGVVGLTRALAAELRGEGIAVNAVCPGSVDTEMLRVGMPGARPDMTPEEIAGVVLYLAASAPSALTGSCVDVFG
jgi:NAD(P)-dependent dehydrogenase (short-subunit alcohol dehydrogenase family)